MQSATKTIETDEDIVAKDSRLVSLIEAKRSFLARWKQQRLNRKLKKKVAELNSAIEHHCKVLCRQQWDEICNRAYGQLHRGCTWNLIRHLLDDAKTKSHQRDRLARLLHTTMQQGKDAVMKSMEAKYLPDTPTDTHPPYGGLPNAWFERDITVSEVQVALHELNTRSAAGPDLVTNKTLGNLDDASIVPLAHYFNERWRSGKLPRQWKTARTILIPKPGKPPVIGNLRPI